MGHFGNHYNEENQDAVLDEKVDLCIELIYNRIISVERKIDWVAELLKKQNEDNCVVMKEYPTKTAASDGSW